jgi:hypothetical protein
VNDGRKTVSFTVKPIRVHVRTGQFPAFQSSASFVKVAGKWQLQGPVKGFIEILGPGPRKLHKPLRADT